MNVVALLLHAAVAVSSVLLVHQVTASRRGPGGPIHYRVEAAFLNGGPARVVDSALASLAADGRVAVGGPGIVHVVRPVGHDPVEGAVLHELATAPSGALHTVRLAAMRHPAVQEIGDRLAHRGLLVPRDSGRASRRWSMVQAVSCFLLLPASIAATVVEYTTLGLGDDIPFPFVVKVLPALLAGLVTALVCAAVSGRRLTGAGRRALASYRGAQAHMTRPGDLVALHGLRALPDPVLREQLVAAARMYGRRGGGGGGAHQDELFATTSVAVWCASADTGGAGCGGGCGGGGGGGSACSGGSGCGSGGGGGGGGSSCGSGGGGSSCGGGGGGD
ncbi:TIGR04222 domain-containing membrane protein [Streptomyces lavendofoliae]|uniref:TIGR04222 domain-containing membrane protein n=1 Tax=Streptomyces lavendofoliae TaxID=67314 RepID=UPI00300F45FC